MTVFKNRRGNLEASAFMTKCNPKDHISWSLDALGQHAGDRNLRLCEFSKSLTGRAYTRYTTLALGTIHTNALDKENNIQFVKPKGTNACESEMKRPSTSCLIPVSVQDCGSDTAKQVECQNQEDIQPVSVDSKPAVENYNLDA
ncbi:hypothetical protein TIFTF001_043637 [Ficus carica]|uniref:Uncharacterized protein n=1 Tax=Ficus carica TaxID=3494 RepID=A0AA87YU89_FICCA|nr:hypothetical protein TIFTF001_043637 [Ficus carica]